MIRSDKFGASYDHPSYHNSSSSLERRIEVDYDPREHHHHQETTVTSTTYSSKYQAANGDVIGYDAQYPSVSPPMSLPRGGSGSYHNSQQQLYQSPGSQQPLYHSPGSQQHTFTYQQQYGAAPRSPSLHSTNSRTRGQQQLQLLYDQDQDPYVNLPSHQQQTTTTYHQQGYRSGGGSRGGSASGSQSNLHKLTYAEIQHQNQPDFHTAGGDYHHSGGVTYVEHVQPAYGGGVTYSEQTQHLTNGFDSHHQQQQQNEYVNYNDPDVRAAQASLQDVRLHDSQVSLNRRTPQYAATSQQISASGTGSAAAVMAQPVFNGMIHDEVDVSTTQQRQYTQEQTVRSEQRRQTVETEQVDGWRDPGLPDLIEYLKSGSEQTQSNAAAYIQHITYLEDEMKTQVRVNGGIHPLCRLLATENLDLLRNVLGALRNLSYGRAQEENKKEIYRCGALQEINQILLVSQDQECRELATAVLWNLSSTAELKRPIIDICLDTLVRNIFLPHSGLELRGETYVTVDREIYWTTVFRNASGVIRSVSSNGEYARKRLRFADGLVECLIQIVRVAIGNSDWDNKAVENCVCTIRNLTYACQEVEDPNYLRRRDEARKSPGNAGNKGSMAGCFGKKGNKKAGGTDQKQQNGNAAAPVIQRRIPNPVRSMDLLWTPDIIPVLLPLVSDCTNPETLEAAAGTIQNLSACDWQPSIDIRSNVRKEKGLPLLVELLSLDCDKVVQVAATALRNLAQDERNKELIGKYALETLTSRLPKLDDPVTMASSGDTHVAVLATIYTVVKDNAQFAGLLLDYGGVHRCIQITSNPAKFTAKLVRFANTLLHALWQLKELHPRYTEKGLSESDFLKKGSAGQRANISNTDQSQSGPSMRQNTMPKNKMVQRPQQQQQTVVHGYDNTAYEPRFPPGDSVGNIPMQQQQPEPLYAQVDRRQQQQQQPVDPNAATDSWV